MTRLIVATGDSLAIVEEQGATWNVRLALLGSGTQCVAIDPDDPNTIYAGARGEGIWKSNDGGVRWSNLSTPLGQPDVFALAISPVDGAIYAGCEPSMLFRSEDGGASWDELDAMRQVPSAPHWSFPPRPYTSHVRCIAPSPHDAALLLTGIELGALLRTTDGGQTWGDHRPGALPDVHTLLWHPTAPGRAYEAGGFGGAAWSHDDGDTWQHADGGSADSDPSLRYTWGLAVAPEDPDLWFISDSPGPMQAHASPNAEARILRRRGDGPWQTLSGGLPAPLDSLPYALLAAPDALYAGLGDGRIFASADRGDTWQPLKLSGDTLPGVRAMCCAA